MPNVNDYPYSSGLIVGADGKVYDLAKLLANEDADTGLRADPNRYPYRGGLIVGSDGNVYDLVTLIQESGGGGGGGGTPSEYLKRVTVSSDGLTATFTKKDGSTVVFSTEAIKATLDAMGVTINTMQGSISTLQSALAGKQDTISDLATIRSNAAAVAGKQDTISDLSTIRTGAGKGATSVQTVNGEEPDASGNVNVSASEGELITLFDEYESHPAWGDVVDVSFASGGICEIYLPNGNLATVLNNTIRIIFTSNGYSNVKLLAGISGMEVLWANDNPWDGTDALEDGKVVEFVVSKSYGDQILVSWSEFTRSI